MGRLLMVSASMCWISDVV